MDMIKNALTGSKNSTDENHGETSSPTHSSAHQPHKGASTAGTGDNASHPIYDQFTSSSRGPPHFSNAASLSNPPDSAKGFGPSSTQGGSTASPSLHPDSSHRPTGNLTDELSTASIKSGVLGFPQGHNQHAALQTDPSHGGFDETQAQGAQVLPDRTSTNQPEGSSHLGRDAAMGAGTVGAGPAATHGLHRQKDHDNLRATPEQSYPRTTEPNVERSSGNDFAPATHRTSEQPFERSFHEPEVVTDTDRSFPLAGGVTSRKQAEYPSTTGTTHSYMPATSEREPGTKDRDVGVPGGQGREALAGAAAAATTAGAVSSLPRSEHHDRHHDDRKTLGGTTGAPTTSADELRAEHELRSGHHHDQERSGHPREAMAGATAAAAAASTRDRSENEPTHHGVGDGTNDPYDPCAHAPNDASGPVLTSGPHLTDTANRIDPHLHVPGSFPETPMETPGDGGQGNTGYLTGGSRHPETRSVEPAVVTGVPSERPKTPVTGPTSASTDPKVDLEPRSEDRHHHGRDAAVAGGLGAAGAGAYAAGKHHEREGADVGSEAMPANTSPYSSKMLDPRIDPSATTKPSHTPHHMTGSTTSGGALPASQVGTAQPTSRVQEEPHQKEHHYGRDAGLAGAGAATAGGLYANQQRDERPDSGPASATVGPHKSNVMNVLDPRVQPEPEKQKSHTTTGSHRSDILNRLDPKMYDNAQHQPQDNLGGTATAGYGAQEAARGYDDHRSTQPSAAMASQRYDPTAHDPNQAGQHHYGRDAAVGAGLGAGAGALAHEGSRRGDEPTYNAPPTASQTQPTASQPPVARQYPAQEYKPYQSSAPQQPSEHHYGRDAAVAGGFGAAGAGLYGASKQHGYGAQQPQPYADTQAPTAHERYDSALDPRQQRQDPHQQHHGRDLAAAGGVAAVGGAGAYAYDQEQAKQAEKERLAQQKAHEKELEHQRKEQQKEYERQQKEQQKEIERQQKEEQKAFEHKQKEIEKHHLEEEKHHNKLVAAEDKAHQREMEREQARQQKEAEKAEEKEGKEKKHSLFGFLHRDKKEKSPEESPRHSKEASPRVSKEYVAPGAATTAAAYVPHEGHNKLHKDPPPGHPARDALEHSQHEHMGTGQHQHMGVDGPIGRPNEISGDHETHKGVYGAHPVNEQQHLVTEPHTGLPMNVEKYGDGRGGTDGSNTVGGYHEGVAGGQQGGANWEAIRKANTPY